MRCPSCNATTINGLACHEVSCPDWRLRLTGNFEGLYEHECRECGIEVYSERRDSYVCCESETL